MSETNIHIEGLKTQAAQQILNYCLLVGRCTDTVARNVFRREARKWKEEWDRLDRGIPRKPMDRLPLPTSNSLTPSSHE